MIFGHQLRRTHKKARELGFAKYFSASSSDLAALHLLDQLYATKQLQYIVTGIRRIPPYSATESIAFRILEAAAEQVGYPASRLPTRAT